MKTKLLLHIILILLAFKVSANTKIVDDNEKINLNCTVNIPDVNFKTALVNHNPVIDTNGDGEIQCSEATAFKGLINVGSKNITDLTGIEAFTSLPELACHNNQLTTLDLSQNTSLTLLNCSGNQITELNLSQQNILQVLNCSNNQLIKLNVSNGNNHNIPNTKFNTTNNPNLTCIEVDDITYSTNTWTNIDSHTSFSTNCNACIVNIPDTNFKTALLNHNPVIDTDGDGEIQCDEATAFSGILNVAIKNISDLTGIEAFANITELYCKHNSLTTINVSDNKELKILDCGNNNISTLDITQNIKLTELYCASQSNLTTLDVSKNVDLSVLYLRDNNDLNTIDVSNNIKLKTLDLLNNFSVNQLDVSKNTLLENLVCTFNDLTSLDVSTNTQLKKLECGYMKLTSLDVSNNTELTRLVCNDNSLTSLIISNGNNTKITSSNDFTTLNNPNLTCIEVDDVTYSTNTWTNIDSHTSFSTNCSLSVKDFELENINIYPNPASNIIRIQLQEPLKKVEIYNLQGRKISENYKQDISIDNLSNGLYILKIHAESGKVGVRRLMKK